MARRRTSRKTGRKFRPIRWLTRWTLRALSVAFLLAVVLVLLGRFVNTPITPYQWQERSRLGDLNRTWVAMDDIAPVMARSAVAAEDANFCLHWGLDVEAIRNAIAEGANRGAWTITQQTVKNVYLWHGRSWFRKALETGLTPLVEALWPKRRILEVYLNIAEFDEGVFGVEAASYHYFGVGPADLSDQQAAQLAAVLPNPKERSASRPSSNMKKRAASIRDGAATIRRDGRAACFED